MKIVVCPDCRGDLDWEPAKGICESCSSTFDIEDGIPILLPKSNQNAEDLSLKLGQAEFFGSADDSEYETHRPHRAPSFHKWLLQEKFRRSLRGLGGPPTHRTALTVCGGSGMDAEFLCTQGFDVVSTDISLGAARNALSRAKTYGLSLNAVVADIDKLPFRDRSFDLAFVHDGLHHITDPYRGLEEMIRVAAEAVSVTEPADAFVTKLAVKFRLADEVEESGNSVKRLRPERVAEVLTKHGFRILNSDRYAMFYRHVPGLASRILSKDSLMPLAVRGWRILNALAGKGGNKMVIVAERQTFTSS